MFHGILTGGEPVDAFAVSGELPEEGARDAFVARTNRVLKAIKAPGMLEKVISSPFGEMPAGNLLMGSPGLHAPHHRWGPGITDDRHHALHRMECPATDQA